MPAHKRTPFQVEHDRAEIERLYLHGEKQATIAEKMGVTQQQISYDLAVIQARWREDSKISLDEAKARELAKIDQLEREYWAGWEASKQAKERTETEKRSEDDKALMRAKVEKREQNADPRYLDGVAWCINRRCQLLGLDAPRKIAPVNVPGDKPYDPFSGIRDVLIGRISAIAAQTGAAAVPGEPEQ